MTHLTFFENRESWKYFMLDHVNKTLEAVSSSGYSTLVKYRHMMGFDDEVKIHSLPNYDTIKTFKKAIKAADFTNIEDPVAYLIDEHPELFI